MKQKNFNVNKITFLMNERCNLHCTYCIEAVKTNNLIDKNLVKEAVDFLFASNHKDIYFFILGGEVFVDRDLLYWIFNTINNANKDGNKTVSIQIQSNGTLINESDIAFFESLKNIKLEIIITVDGFTYKDNQLRLTRIEEFNAIKKSIFLIHKSKLLKLKFAISVCDSNINNISNMIKVFSKTFNARIFTCPRYKTDGTVDLAYESLITYYEVYRDLVKYFNDNKDEFVEFTFNNMIENNEILISSRNRAVWPSIDFDYYIKCLKEKKLSHILSKDVGGCNCKAGGDTLTASYYGISACSGCLIRDLSSKKKPIVFNGLFKNDVNDIKALYKHLRDGDHYCAHNKIREYCRVNNIKYE